MTYIDNAKQWLGSTFDKDTKNQIQHLLDTNPEELEDLFYKDLEFGTGGMRGVMGIGTNRINTYTLGRNTQGICNYLHASSIDEKSLSVVIAYDCRHQSDTLAQCVAEVFSANDIQVYIFSSLRTTPELSFAVRQLKCDIGIVLTASHNPPEYNGYKVYNNEGGQIVPPQDQDIISAINQVHFNEINFSPKHDLIQKIDQRIDEAFFEAAVHAGSFNAEGKNDLSIVFTPIHGTSITAIPQVLQKAGYHNVNIIKEQAEPNGNGAFPTVVSPNPEEAEALNLALTKADEIKADIVIGTDPDSDRLGIAVRDANDKMILLNGNQTMVVMTQFLLEEALKKGLNGNEFIASTIVSTPMILNIAKKFNLNCKISLTGFKWIGKMITDFPELKFIGGGEESYGYMVADFVRDKDAVTSTLLACEIASQCKANGSSFYNYLIDCYVEYGLYQEKLVSITKKGKKGAEEIEQMMLNFKKTPPTSIAGSKVKFFEDYATSEKTNLFSGEKAAIALPKSKVFIFETEDGTRVAARPSGTEPKIKFYISANTSLNSKEEYAARQEELEKKIQRILTEFKLN
ncbi:MAG: phosphoglucomutase [Flavobacteriaceae bacterium]|nr:phosphoglucomutase [Flavobacteriaceae bacterium]